MHKSVKHKYIIQNNIKLIIKTHLCLRWKINASQSFPTSFCNILFLSFWSISTLVPFSREEQEVGPAGQVPDKPQLQTGNAGKIWHLCKTTPKNLATMLTSKQLQAGSMSNVEKQKVKKSRKENKK